MTGSFPRSSTAASPWGLVLSVCLHGMVFLAIIALSFSVSKVTKPTEEIVSRVTLVEGKLSAPVAEQMKAAATEPPSLAPEVVAQPEVPKKATEKPRATLEARAMAPHNRDVIPVKKRKKPARRVEVAKEPAKKKPQPDTAKKKEDPKAFLEKRLAAIRQEMESKKTDAAISRSSQAVGSQTAGKPEGKQGGPSVDEQLARWFDGVKTKINTHWSILGDDRQSERVTVIGVRIADNGRLMDASVDESSGDKVFDRSAMRAVVQADPFPPIPSEVKEQISKAGGLAFRFTPKGMQ